MIVCRLSALQFLSVILFGKAISLYVVSKVKTSEWEQDVLDKTEEDVLDGAMSPIIDLDEDVLESVHLARRIPVREIRNGKYGTRVVDHESENGVAAAT